MRQNFIKMKEVGKNIQTENPSRNRCLYMDGFVWPTEFIGGVWKLPEKTVCATNSEGITTLHHARMSQLNKERKIEKMSGYMYEVLKKKYVHMYSSRHKMNVLIAATPRRDVLSIKTKKNVLYI